MFSIVVDKAIVGSSPSCRQVSGRHLRSRRVPLKWGYVPTFSVSLAPFLSLCYVPNCVLWSWATNPLPASQCPPSPVASVRPLPVPASLNILLSHPTLPPTSPQYPALHCGSLSSPGSA